MCSSGQYKCAYSVLAPTEYIALFLCWQWLLFTWYLYIFQRKCLTKLWNTCVTSGTRNVYVNFVCIPFYFASADNVHCMPLYKRKVICINSLVFFHYSQKNNCIICGHHLAIQGTIGCIDLRGFKFSTECYIAAYDGILVRYWSVSDKSDTNHDITTIYYMIAAW